MLYLRVVYVILQAFNGSMIIAGEEEEGFSTSSSTIIIHTHPTFNRIQHEIPSRTQKVPLLKSSAGFLADNGDLLMQIWVRLPIKSLIRLQSVSKRWFSIISDPFFRRLHFRTAAEHGTYFLYRRWEKELNFVTESGKFVNPMGDTVSNLVNSFNKGQILGFHSCNGLVAIALSYKDSNHVDFFVYNPATRQRKKIPPCYEYPVNCPHSRSEFIALNIAFDPLQLDHYTLVYIWFDMQRPADFFLSIYKSEFQAWMDKYGMVNYDVGESILWSAGVLWNGDLHWVSEYGYSMSLDLVQVNARKAIITLAEEEERAMDMYFFGECGGDLCVMGQPDPQSLVLDVFKLEPDYSRWDLVYCIDLSVLPVLYPLVIGDVHEIEYDSGMWKTWKFSVSSCSFKEKRLVLMISLPGKVISYNTHGMIAEEIADVAAGFHDPDTDRFGWNGIFKYVETFASV